MEVKSELQFTYVPAKEKTFGKAPVILALHGVGSNENDLAVFAENLDPRFAVMSLRGPLTLGEQSYAWFRVRFGAQGPDHNREEAEVSRVKLKHFIEALKNHSEVDASKVFLLGFSQGTIMSLSLALTEPELVRGVVAIAGRTLQEIAVQAQERSYNVRPKILLLHGELDNKLPLFHAGETAETLKKAGFDFNFKTYLAGHEITGEMRDDIRAWLALNI